MECDIIPIELIYLTAQGQKMPTTKLPFSAEELKSKKRQHKVSKKHTRN